MLELSNMKYESKMLVEENCMIFPTSFSSEDIDCLENVTDFLPESISSDNNDLEVLYNLAHSSSAPIHRSSMETHNELSVGGPNVDHEAKISSQDSNFDAPRTQRVRKPTRRYIDELALAEDLNPRCVKKKDKCHKFKNSMKQNEHLAEEFQAEETLCEAIQVPFGPPVPEECRPEPNRDGDKKCAPEVKKVNQDMMPSFASEICHKRYELAVYNPSKAIPLEPRPEECDKKCMFNGKPVNGTHTLSFGSKECSKSPTSCHVNKVLTSDEEDIEMALTLYDERRARRKHHRLWTVTEVKKLIDGVSQFGVGRWSQIKKLFFSASDHRTPVDLKDKWRNLLKASYLQTQSKKPGKGAKQNFSWRPLPKPILHKVIELATVHPYPRNCKSKNY
ncbi:unnamed protein product [Cuscuta campestris]|uniref:Uncharacterized protein n=1 Tax=Cuscuta campestris TaxID=132261 RepID=A0A484NCM0_9ASTE|nr:unnamed protein product [Cuscuta campestris]